MSDLRQELIELSDFFSNSELPEGEIKINNYMTIVDVRQYVTAEFKRIQKYSANEATWDREFKHIRDLKRSIEAKNS